MTTNEQATKRTRVKVEKKFKTLPEASEYLNLTKATLYRFLMRKEIPYYKPNQRKIYFLTEDLDKWIMKNRISSNAEINEEISNY